MTRLTTKEGVKYEMWSENLVILMDKNELDEYEG